MACQHCRQPVHNCGRSDRRSVSFEVEMVHGYENGVVMFSSYISDNVCYSLSMKANNCNNLNDTCFGCVDMNCCSVLGK